jgi:tRNA (cmo5U34)-methyltransferase
MKSTVEEIRARFDADVERFSNLETGQTATVDARLAMELVAQAAAASTPNAKSLLDVGCGAGNYSLMVLQELPDLNVSLIDLSEPMLERAVARVQEKTGGEVRAIQGDVRELDLGEAQFDVIVASAVLHHLRDESEWRDVFTKFFRALKDGGSIWIFDLVESSIPAIQTLMWNRYGEYLSTLKDEEYRDTVFAYIEKEDTQRPLIFQLDLLREVGFANVEVLHKNSCFAAFGGVKSQG